MRFAGTNLASYIDTMDHSAIAGQSMKGRSAERQAVMQGEGMVANAGVQSMGKVQSAQYQADAIEAQGAAQGQASMASGLGSMVSGLAGGIGSMGGSGGASNYGFDPAGSQGNPFGTGPRVRTGGY